MKKKIVNHKWYCRKHKMWIGEGYNCPFCKYDVKVLDYGKYSSLKKTNNTIKGEKL